MTFFESLSKKNILFSSICAFILAGCSNSLPVKNEVIIHELSDPETMNPFNFTDAQSAYITAHVYQKLIDGDYRKTDEFIPVLAESRPKIEKTPEGKMHLTFVLRKEAKWDNGSPVLASDVEFSLKTMRCPLVNNTNAKTYLEFINDFISYPDNPRKFTIVSNEPYFVAEATFTDMPVIPEYFYDPKGLIKGFTIKQLSEKGDSLSADPKMKEYADDFNSEKRMRDTNFISGSGPYKFAQWVTNERLVLRKKAGWWGDSLEKENCQFEAYPDKLIFQMIKDQSTAIVSLKAGNIDVMRGIKSKDFNDLPQSEKFTSNFNAYTPVEYSYLYIALNTKHPLLKDIYTRQAVAHLVDVPKIISTIKYGNAQPIVGPIHPSKTRSYNSSIPLYDFDLNKAKELLEKAGWKNTNGDETLDKVIDGKRTEFVLDFIVNAGNDERKAIALMFQEQAKKVGITVNVLTLDWAVFLGRNRNHEFCISIGKWISGPAPDELKSTFHSSSATGEGSNFSNYSNPEADAIMDSIRVEIDENKRYPLYHRLQELFHDDVPMIFLYSPTEHIAIHKKFENAYPSVARPGYWAPGFQIKAASAQ